MAFTLNTDIGERGSAALLLHEQEHVSDVSLDEGYVSRVLRQLHDGPLQCVAAAQLALQSGNVAFASQALADAAQQLRDTVQSGNSLLVDICDLVRHTQRMFHGRTGTVVDVDGPTTVLLRDAEKSDLVRRTVRECLINAFKRDNLTVKIQTRVDGDHVHLSAISTLKPDCGRAAATHGAGFGLKSLSRQATAAGGSFTAGRCGDQWVAQLKCPS